VPIEDVQEVSNYFAAMNHGLERLRSGFPLSLRLIREIHEILLAKGRGSGKQPGEFRRSQNWIGRSRPSSAAFVPPPPELVQECLGQFELFLHDKQSGLPLLVKTGVIHVQFESIHPFPRRQWQVGTPPDHNSPLCPGCAPRTDSLFEPLFQNKSLCILRAP
jgi:Fic family protein